ncbi:unnamed protein product [Phytomonas sp. EM1]|nr:unnamed protein product [Phytomonas sp. EM1]|eukprot:CCW65661.1 unnamed protein product [Phytomonas sp. isolate EM1]
MFRRTPAVARKAVSNFLHEPNQKRTFKEAMEYCQRENIDMASQLSSDFMLLQSKLLKYRVVRLAHEVQAIWQKPFSCLPSIPAALGHLILLPVTFTIGFVVGRCSLEPLIPPPESE